MDEEKRISGLLEMASQHMKRFRELEEIEWRINFSIWALLGGLAYLWITGKMTAAAWMKSPCAFLLLPIPVVLLHGAALFALNRQQQTHAILRNHYRDQVDELISRPIPKQQFHHVGGLRLRDWWWVGWAVFVTFALSESVLFLMRTAVPRQ